MLRAMAAAGLGGYVLCGINNTRRGDGLLADLRRADVPGAASTDAEHLSLLDGLDLAGVRVAGRVVAGVGRALAAGAGELVPQREVEAIDTFMMIFTSGTSGDPKAVQVSHLMVLIAGVKLADRFSLTPDDTCYVSMPLFHSNAVVAGWAVAVASGAAIAPAKFIGLAASCPTYAATARPTSTTSASRSPTCWPRLSSADDADNPLRIAFGNEASDRDIDEFSRRFDCVVWDGFGSTETAIIITREPGTPKGSIGKGIDGVAIYDPETVTECAVAVFDEHGALTNADDGDR